MTTPKVMIGVPTADFARRADFYDYLAQIDKPDGWTVLEGKVHGQSPARNRNLIKIEVFKKMKELDPLPWVRLGEIPGEEDHWGDDIGFWKRARKAGFKLFCDLTVCGAHICSMTLRPVYKDGIWYTEYDTNGSGAALVPAFYQPELAGVK